MRTNTLHRYIAALVFALIPAANASAQSLFPASIDLINVAPGEGVIIDGINDHDFNGFSVARIGDINNDGRDDFAIGAPYAGDFDNFEYFQGKAFILFGSPDIADVSTIDLANLNGHNGFTLTSSEDLHRLGFVVAAAGDINDDGVDDFLVTADGASVGEKRSAGVTYIIFGDPDIGAGGALDHTALDGGDGFTFVGAHTDDHCGHDADGVGDVNADGVDDIIISSPAANYNGQVYVIFGSTTVGAAGMLAPTDLNGHNGVIINGAYFEDQCGDSVACAGDVNADGHNDIIIGAPYAAPNKLWFAGESYVVFGGPQLASQPVIELTDLDGANGFRILGFQQQDFSGVVSSAGDLNADGVDDIAIAAPSSVTAETGRLSVIFGRPGIGQDGVLDFTALPPSQSILITGPDALSSFGYAIGNAGDLNNDGHDDFAIGAPGTHTNFSGAVYVLFASSSFNTQPVCDLDALDGADGFVAYTLADDGVCGASVGAAGDINHDGADDLLIGAPWTDMPGAEHSGRSYIIFGKSPIPADLTGDGVITALDLATLLSYWGTCPAQPTPCIADLDGSGDVGAADLAEMIGYWGS